MSNEIKELVKRLDEQWDRRRFSDSPFGEMSCLLADAADALEALVAERDSLKAEVERLRGEQRLKSLIGPSENAVERIIAERDHLKVVLVRTAASLAAAISLLESVVKERDSLREVVNNLSCNWIDCSDCDRNRELIESFVNKEEKKEI